MTRDEPPQLDPAIEEWLDGFLATLSHDLRNPLNAMLGWAHLLQSDALPADMRQRALEKLERNGRAQAEILNDLLEVSRTVGGRTQLLAGDAAFDTPAVRAARPHTPDRSTALAGVRLLLVEDEPDGREFLAILLGMHGASVEVASSVVEALRLVETGQFDVLVSDLGLPDRDGYELIRTIRLLASNSSLPAVAVTASASPQDRARALEAGYGWHIPKPVDPALLLEALSEAIGNARDSRPSDAR
ncbi:MAG TPA: response regulator [Vicinamibacterales bacterium]|nr:response regulator [Vicinamibacterales bacterium]